jgi:iron complex transport system ATP-binding protein
LLSTTKIAVSYDARSGTHELDDVSVSILPGQITAIVGPNGSGKSTLIRALSRILHPVSGQVLLDGSDLYRAVTAQESARSISVAPQDTHVAFDFTGRDIVAMGRVPHRTGWSLVAAESNADRTAIDEALKNADISPTQAARAVMTLSGGERQRILIARALVQQTDSILLDEPTASLDLAHQTNLLARLKDLAHRDGKAIAIVLHDLTQAAAFADRLVVLSKGKVVVDGEVRSVLTRDLIRDVYHCSVHISEDIVSGGLVVTAIPDIEGSRSLDGKTVHVICGGGGGTAVLRQLAQAGAQVTAGPLHRSDTDYAVAFALNVECEPLIPFVDVPMPDEIEVRKIIGSCSALVLAVGGYGSLNANSFAAALKFTESGVPTYLSKATWEMLHKCVGESHITKFLEEFSPFAAERVFDDEAKLIAAIARGRNA